MSTTSRAVVFRGAGGPEVMGIEPRAVRAPGPSEVRVRVAAAGLNRADVLQRRGLYPAPPGAPVDVPGLEYAGTVEVCGEGVSRWRVGDRVMGLVGGGGMGGHVVVHEREALAVPEGLGLEEAAALPEAFLTAWDALVEQGGFRPGMVVLVHAAGSGVGTAAVQLVGALGGVAVGTSRRPEKLARLATLGARAVILVPTEGPARFSDALVREVGRGADLILETVGAAYLAEDVRALSPRGAIVVLGLLAGASAELPLGALLARRGRIVGSTLRARPIEEKIALVQAFEREVSPLFASGVLRPVVAEVVPMEGVADAHRAMEADATFGKIVVRID